MIRSRIKVNGKTIAVCKMEQGDKTISELMENDMGKKKRQKSRGTYHAHPSRRREDKERRDGRLKRLIHALTTSGQECERAILKAKISLEALRKALGKEETLPK